MFEIFLRIGIFKQINKMLDPAKIFIIRCRVRRLCRVIIVNGLVVPMRGHTSFSCIMHFRRAYLDFNLLIERPNNPGMDRLIAITFWR